MNEEELTGRRERERSGDVRAFDQSWRSREETHYTHWTRGEPENQIQLAFRQHWILFQELMGANFTGRRCLEVGCGRGSISAYFADAGFDCTLLDLSPAVIETAKSIFRHHNLPAKFVVGDALNLPFPEKSFDVIVSIGLLEHFEDIRTVLSEQIRVLDRGGLFLGYVVPELPDNIQKDYRWMNDLIRALMPEHERVSAAQKPDIYRSAALSNSYVEVMRELPLRDIGASGVYPLPMISHSPSFPFTLLKPECEEILVRRFTEVLATRRQETGKNPWLCDEKYGQAFLLWGRKS
jgi:ubiquinone/menaquinone biosynthesis C-methylase UbiE